MAKKRTTSAIKPRDSQVAAVDDNRVAFQLRLDKDLHEKLRLKADEAGISLNQLIQGLCRGTVEWLIAGEVSKNRHGTVVVNRAVKKCLGVGQEGYYLSEFDRATWHENADPRYDPETPPDNQKGFLWFGLDFTDRGVVQYSQD